MLNFDANADGTLSFFKIRQHAVGTAAFHAGDHGVSGKRRYAAASDTARGILRRDIDFVAAFHAQRELFHVNTPFQPQRVTTSSAGAFSSSAERKRRTGTDAV